MNNGNTPAMPQSGDAYTDISGYKDIPGRIENGMGLSKLEHISAMAMQGLISSWGAHDVTDYDEMASDAVMAAKALLSQLEKAK